MPNTELIFLIEDLYGNANGVVTSAMQTIRCVEDAGRSRPLLLSSIYNTHAYTAKCLHELQDPVLKRARLNKDTRYFSVFDFFQNAFPYNPNVQFLEQKPCDNGSESQFEWKEESPGVYKAYIGDKHYKTETFDSSAGKLNTIDIFDGDGTKTKTFQYDFSQNLSRITVWDAQNQKYHPIEYYLSPEKTITLAAEYSWEAEGKNLNPTHEAIDEHNVLKRYVVYDENENPKQFLNHHEELIAYCLNELTKDQDKAFVLIDETSLYSRAVALIQRPNVARAAVVHARFTDTPNVKTAPPSAFYKNLCADRNRFDGIVFLTHGEKSDFVRRFGFSKNYYDIGHSYPYEITPVEYESRDPNKIAVISRFDPIKRLNATVGIFKLISDELPDMTMDIYGFGGGIFNTEDKVKEQIKSLGLEEKVKLMGYTNRADEVFSKAALSIMTSESEGFGLTLVESICNGCPAFACNVPYGPPEIIKDGKTGFLIKDGDKELFAKKVIAFLKDESLRRQMSENCYADAVNFSVAKYMEKWLAFVDALARKCVCG